MDSFIDSGSDQELFVSSYIHGHFSVVAANLLHVVKNAITTKIVVKNKLDTDKNQLSSVATEQSVLQYFCHCFFSELSASIDTAVANKELSTEDAEQVFVLLEKLQKSV